MSRWLLLLGGMIVWAIHFLGLYGIASVAAVVKDAEAPAALWIMGAFTLLCVGADVVVGAIAIRRNTGSDDGLDRWVRFGGAGAAGLSLVAVIWQGLPILVAR